MSEPRSHHSLPFLGQLTAQLYGGEALAQSYSVCPLLSQPSTTKKMETGPSGGTMFCPPLLTALSSHFSTEGSCQDIWRWIQPLCDVVLAPSLGSC